jgi:hypothetical protein
MAKSTSPCSFLQPPITSPLFGQNILLNTLFSYTLSLYSSLNVRDQVSHPYTTTGKIIVLYILIFMFLDGRREDKRFWTEWQQALGGSLVTTAGRVLRLRMEETPSRFGEKLRIYRISSRGQPTRGGPPAWGLGVGLTTPHRKNKLVTKILKKKICLHIKN